MIRALAILAAIAGWALASIVAVFAVGFVLSRVMMFVGLTDSSGRAAIASIPLAFFIFAAMPVAVVVAAALGWLGKLPGTRSPL